jgi:hypothetical protein
MDDNVTVKMQLAGIWTQIQASRNAQIRGFMTMNFPNMPSNSLQILASQTAGTTSTNEDVDVTNREFQELLAELTDRTDSTEQNIKKLVRVIETMNSVRQFDVGKYVSEQFVFGNLNMQYCDRLKSFFASGPAALLAINGQTINKVVQIKLAYNQGRRQANGKFRSDTLRMYVSLDPNEFEWFYVEWRANEVHTVSSMSGYNGHVRDLENKQQQRAPREGDLRFHLCQESRKDAYLQYFSGFLLGGCSEDGSPIDTTAAEEPDPNQPFDPGPRPRQGVGEGMGNPNANPAPTPQPQAPAPEPTPQPQAPAPEPTPQPQAPAPEPTPQPQAPAPEPEPGAEPPPPDRR